MVVIIAVAEGCIARAPGADVAVVEGEEDVGY